MGWSITGWSGGARQPVSYRLRAGQFRGMGTVRGYSNNIFVNNNYYNSGFSGYNYGYGCNCNSNSGTPKWMNWMMGLGMGTSLLGNVLGLFNIGKNKDVEGKGGAETKAKTDVQAESDNNCKNIKTLFGDDVKSVVYMNNKYTARLKDGTILTDTDPNKLIDQIQTKLPAKPAEKKDAPVKKKPVVVADPKDNVGTTKPNLFESTKMEEFEDTDAVLKEFKKQTGADATSIDDVKNNGNGITISVVEDKGNNTTYNVNIKLTKDDLAQVADKKSVSKDKIGNKDVSFENLDGYIRMKVGNQTYIVGSLKDNDGTKYNAYQYEKGNVTGYNEANWRKN